MTVLAGLYRLKSLNLSHNQIHTIIQVSSSGRSLKKMSLLVCLIKTKKSSNLVCLIYMFSLGSSNELLQKGESSLKASDINIAQPPHKIV